MHICGYEIWPTLSNDDHKILFGAAIGLIPSMIMLSLGIILNRYFDKAKKLKESDTYVKLHILKHTNFLISTRNFYLDYVNQIGGVDAINNENILTIVPSAIDDPEISQFDYNQLNCLFDGGSNEALNAIFELERKTHQVYQLSIIHRKKFELLENKLRDIKTPKLENKKGTFEIGPEHIEEVLPEFHRLKDSIRLILSRLDNVDKYIDDVNTSIQTAIRKTRGKKTKTSNLQIIP